MINPLKLKNRGIIHRERGGGNKLGQQGKKLPCTKGEREEADAKKEKQIGYNFQTLSQANLEVWQEKGSGRNPVVPEEKR